MIVVGEKINTSRRNIAEAVEKRDAEFIGKVARDQAEAGAHYIDVNAGTFVDEEVDCLCWLVETVQSEVNLPLCLDSPNPKALSEALKRHKGEPMINSISLEKDRFSPLLSVVTSQPCKVVALCMAQTSMPRTVEERVSVGSGLISKLTDEGIPIGNIYVDPLVQPVSVDTSMGAGALGNYVNLYSAIRIGLIPMVAPDIVTSLGNAATTGASMVLLSKDYWQKASELVEFIEHVELSSRTDFNQYFIEHMNFPQGNIW